MERGNEVARRDRALPHGERCLAALHRVLEHVVEHEHPTGDHEPRPSLVVAERDIERVATVDEHEPERSRPVGSHHR